MPSEATSAPVNEEKLTEFLHQVVGDMGAAYSAALVYIGDRLGLYKTMADSGPMNSTELAVATGTTERDIREWLINQAAGGYLTYDPPSGRYALPREHAIALTDEDSPYFVAGGFQTFSALMRAVPRIMESFQTGAGMPWGDHHSDLFHGTERFFRPSYLGNLVNSWIPSIAGLKDRLEQGAVLADVGCGHGASTLILAKAFPRSRFVGFDSHGPSIERATAAASAENVSNLSFKVADAVAFPGENYDAIAFFDCFHDLADPAGAAKRAFETLKPDGVVMMIEPMAGARVEENFNPVGRVFSAASVLCCTPNALSGGKHALGTVASDDALSEMYRAGGFTRFRRATETPFNRVFEIKK